MHKRCKKQINLWFPPFQNGSTRPGPSSQGSSGALERNPHPLSTPVMVKQGDVAAGGGGGGFCKYVSFPVPTKCCLSQLSEDQFLGPKRAIKQQNKQRVWRQEPGQRARLITRDVVASSQTPPHPFHAGSGEGERVSAPHCPSPQHC